MADPQPAESVKLLVAVLWADAVALEAAFAALRERWGPMDFVGNDHLFDATRYYEPEMGRTLQRRLVAFAGLFPPEQIRQAKLACNEIEKQLAGPHGRHVNLDIGYLDDNKIVLASVKYAGQKIHLGDGIYADLIARFRGGRYCPLEWTFPDFRDGRYDDELAVIRRTYLMQRRSQR